MKDFRPALAPSIAAVVLVLAIFGPDFGTLGSHFLGIEEVDHYGTQWFYDFASRVLTGSQAATHTDLLFHPWGKDVFAHTGSNLLDAFLAAPFRALLGPVLGYNLFVLAGLLLNGWAMYALARDLFPDRAAAAWSALLFAANPFLLVELAEGRPTQALVGLLPLILLLALRTGRKPGWRAPILGGVLLALSGYQYWFYGLFSGLVVLVLAFIRTAKPLSGDRSATVLRFMVFLGLGLLLVSPVALSLAAQAQAAGAVPGQVSMEGWTAWSLTAPTTFEGHEIALLTWQPLLGETGYYTVRANGDEVFIGHQAVASGVGLVSVLGFLALSSRNEPAGMGRRAWCFLLLALGVLATGPLLVVGEYYFVDPIYTAGMEAIGLFRRLWWPGRALAWIAVLVGLASAGLLTQILRRWGRRAQAASGTLLAALALLHLFRFGLAPFPTWDAHVPAGYRCLAEPDGSPGALIELPFGWSQAHLYHQGTHSRPILGGMLESNPVFQPEEARVLRTENPWMAMLLAIPEAGGRAPAQPPSGADEVHALGFRYVILQKAALLTDPSGQQLRATRRDLQRMVGSPVYEDARTAIYAPWDDPRPCPADFEPDLDAPLPHRSSQVSGVVDLPVRKLSPLR